MPSKVKAAELLCKTQCLSSIKRNAKFISTAPFDCQDSLNVIGNTILQRSVLKMNGNAELLNFIYQNSQMGVDTINQLIGIVEDEKMKTQLKSQFNEYKEIHDAAQKALNENGYDEKGIGALDKIKTYLMINMQTLADKSPSHISEMLIIGSNMGVINAVKNLKKYQSIEPKIVRLMEKLLKFEENNIQQLKEFL